MKKRQLKKIYGSNYKVILDILKYGGKLKVGDLVSTCRGYNERIASIGIEVYNTKTNKSFVWDYQIELTSGAYCSLRNCIIFPLQTKEQIIQYWNKFDNPKGYEYALLYLNKTSIKIIKNINNAFNENGELII